MSQNLVCVSIKEKIHIFKMDRLNTKSIASVFKPFLGLADSEWSFAYLNLDKPIKKCLIYQDVLHVITPDHYYRSAI